MPAPGMRRLGPADRRSRSQTLRSASGTLRAALTSASGPRASLVPPSPGRRPAAARVREGEPAFSRVWRASRCSSLSVQSDGGREARSLRMSPGCLGFLKNGSCTLLGLRRRRPPHGCRQRSGPAPRRLRILAASAYQGSGPDRTTVLDTGSPEKLCGRVLGVVSLP